MDRLRYPGREADVGGDAGVTTGPTPGYAPGVTAGATKLTLREAAEVLGVSKEAVRKRVARGTVEHETGEDGRVYVYLPEGGDARADAGGDDGGDASADGAGGGDGRPSPEAGLIGALEARIASLERSLDAERHAHSETRRIAAMLAARVPELEATPNETGPPNAPGSPKGGAEADGGTNGREGERRSWWRTILGG